MTRFRLAFFSRAARACIAVGAAASVATLIAGCDRSQPVAPPVNGDARAPGDTVSVSETGRALVSLETTTVRVGALVQTRTVPGVLEADPASVALVNARVRAKMLSLSSRVGDRVRAGETIAVVESEDLHGAQTAYRQALRRAALMRDSLARRVSLAGNGEFVQPRVTEARRVRLERETQASEARSEIARADAAHTEATQDRDVLAAESARAKARLDAVRRRAERADALLREELIARQEFEQAQADLAVARADVDAADASVRRGDARIATTKAMLSAARERAGIAQNQLALATGSEARELRVARSGAGAGQELDSARAALDQARIDVDSARDDIELLGGQPGDMHSIPIHAPINGQIVAIHASLGETLDAGKPIYTVQDGARVLLRLDIPSSLLPQIRPGLLVETTVDSAPGRTFRAIVESVGEAADPQTRRVTVRCRLAPSPGLRAGLLASARIRLRADTGPLAPETALVETESGATIAFVQTAPGVYERRTVRIGARADGQAQVLSGLRAGEKVVSRNAALLLETQP